MPVLVPQQLVNFAGSVREAAGDGPACWGWGADALRRLLEYTISVLDSSGGRVTISASCKERMGFEKLPPL